MRPWLAVAAVVLVVAGCAAGPALPPPAAPQPSPDLRGTWVGMWGADPVALTVVEQADPAAPGGLAIGSLVTFGQRGPDLTGVMTTTRGTATATVNVRGWLGGAGRSRLVVYADSPHGPQSLDLVLVEPDRLAGTGTSGFAWGPRGPAALARQR
jgi:hypothetical protein